MKTVHTETFDGKKLPALQAGNPAPRADGLYPLNSLYEPGITPDGADTLQSFSVVSKAQVLLGRHAPETRSGALLGMTAAKGKNVQGLITLFPAGSLADTDEFTVSYIVRVHKPAGLRRTADRLPLRRAGNQAPRQRERVCQQFRAYRRALSEGRV